MAYQKTQWQDHIEGVQTGTPVNAANMNKIEEGIAAVSNIRQIDITPLVPDNGGDLMCRCWINPWHGAHLMIRWSLRAPLTGTIDFARLPDECLPIMAFDTTCVLRSQTNGIEAGIVNIGWGGQISICRSTTSVNDTFTMLCANINYHTYY